jgi:hypothetical protein
MQKTASRPNSTKVNLVVDLVIFLVFLITTAPHFMGIAIHEWLSISFGAMIIAHLLLHWQWLVETTRRIFTTASLQARINYVLNTALFIDMTLLIFTGLLISRSVLPTFGLRLATNFFWRGLHTTTSDLAVFIIGLHVALHWKWVTNSVSRYLFRPLGNALQLNFAACTVQPSRVQSARVAQKGNS